MTVTLADPRIKRVTRRQDNATVNLASTEDDVTGVCSSILIPYDTIDMTCADFNCIHNILGAGLV